MFTTINLSKIIDHKDGNGNHLFFSYTVNNNNYLIIFPHNKHNSFERIVLTSINAIVDTTDTAYMRKRITEEIYQKMDEYISTMSYYYQTHVVIDMEKLLAAEDTLGGFINPNDCFLFYGGIINQYIFGSWFSIFKHKQVEVLEINLV